MASVLRTPRPVPVFFNDSPFSQRKRTPFRAPQPPRAPSKSCPPVSRVFPTPNNGSGGSRPQFVSFKSERKPLGKSLVPAPSWSSLVPRPHGNETGCEPVSHALVFQGRYRQGSAWETSRQNSISETLLLAKQTFSRIKNTVNRVNH